VSENDKSFRSSVKDWTSSLQSVFTIIAIIAGGWWFLQQGLAKPRIRLEHTVTCRPLSGEPDVWLLTVDVRVSNTGSVDVHLSKGTLLIGQINPVPGKDLKTETLKELWLEPGESDQAAFRTFEIPKSIKTIQVNSTYSVPGADLEWDFSSAGDLQEDGMRAAATASVNPAAVKLKERESRF
jgi:hypothetical protein